MTQSPSPDARRPSSSAGSHLDDAVVKEGPLHDIAGCNAGAPLIRGRKREAERADAMGAAASGQSSARAVHQRLRSEWPEAPSVLCSSRAGGQPERPNVGRQGRDAREVRGDVHRGVPASLAVRVDVDVELEACGWGGVINDARGPISQYRERVGIAPKSVG